MFIAAAAIAVSASAQKTAVTASKALDNVYVGAALGAETKASKQNQGAFSLQGFFPRFPVALAALNSVLTLQARKIIHFL